jgi:hypothetical protein
VQRRRLDSEACGFLVLFRETPQRS